jgi:hypothetical protein
MKSLLLNLFSAGCKKPVMSKKPDAIGTNHFRLSPPVERHRDGGEGCSSVPPSHPQGRKTEVFSVDDRGGMGKSKEF